LGHHWRAAVAVVGLLLVTGYGLSGLTRVDAGEVGVVRRFGRVLPDDLEPGLHWRWPWPVERVSKVRPGRLRTLEVGFRTLGGRRRRGAEAGSWDSPHGVVVQRYPDEAVMATGDGKLVELQATVHYTIADVRVFLFGVGEPEAALRQATEAVLRELAAGWQFTPLLTRKREEFQRQALARLKERCEAGPGRLGIRLEGLWLQELHPPPEVVTYYHQVANATEGAKQAINEEEARKILRLQQAESSRLRELRLAEADRQRVILQAEADLYVFGQRWQARRRLSLAQEVRLFLTTLGQARPGQSQDELNGIYARLRREELERQARWSDDRLRREVLARTLPGRDMVLVDAPGWLASFLYALDQMREVVPLFFPPERGQRPRPHEP
jgi:regulator of protease activity HflC (stomatin/prohibitin superfamily)